MQIVQPRFHCSLCRVVLASCLHIYYAGITTSRTGGQVHVIIISFHDERESTGGAGTRSVLSCNLLLVTRDSSLPSGCLAECRSYLHIHRLPFFFRRRSKLVVGSAINTGSRNWCEDARPYHPVHVAAVHTHSRR